MRAHFFTVMLHTHPLCLSQQAQGSNCHSFSKKVWKLTVHFLPSNKQRQTMLVACWSGALSWWSTRYISEVWVETKTVQRRVNIGHLSGGQNECLHCSKCVACVNRHCHHNNLKQGKNMQMLCLLLILLPPSGQTCIHAALKAWTSRENWLWVSFRHDNLEQHTLENTWGWNWSSLLLCLDSPLSQCCYITYIYAITTQELSTLLN